METLKVGDRYYYTGDMANIGDFGVITEITTDEWGTFYTGKLDDGRIQPSIHVSAFEKGSGQRFIPIEQYEAERAEKIKKLKDALKR